MRDTKLKKVASTNGGEWAGPCPFCGGKDRFHVQPGHPKGGRWMCRGCGEGRWHDDIDYIKRRDGVDFRTACERLGRSLEGRTSRKAAPQKARQFTPAAPAAEQAKGPPTIKWQQGAHDYCTRCEDTLWGKAGKAGRDYLASRGLTHESVIAAAGLGYNPQPYREQWGQYDVSLPPGIVIPWLIRGEYWNVNMRNLGSGSGKYKRAVGSINSVYRVQYIRLDCTVVMVESEFDALIIRQELFDLNLLVVPVATGSISWGQQLRWLANIAIAEQVLVAFDLEHELEKIKAVERAAHWWLEKLDPKAKRLLPTKHDVTDMLLAGENIAAWIREASGVRPIAATGPKNSETMLANGWLQQAAPEKE